jgi:hypothetical protein
MKSLGFVLLMAGAAIAISDEVVTSSATPPGMLGQYITDIDTLNGALSGVAPYIGVGTLLALGGVILIVVEG